MKRRFDNVALCAAALLAAAAIGGCSEEAPPYGELPLRDVLSAAPEVIASLPEDARRDIAQKLEDAEAQADDETTIDGVEVRVPAAVIRQADAAREEQGKDSSVVGAIEDAPSGLVLRSIAAKNEPAGPFELPAFNEEEAATAALEEVALHGRAGAILANLAQRAGAHELIRITGAPVGAFAMDGKVYVNASWLVALSALEKPSGAGAPALGAPGASTFIKPPPKQPLSSVHVNPYYLPSSVEACGSDTTETCACAGTNQCDQEPTDGTFASGKEECDWVNQSLDNAKALCVLALMRIDGIRECVQSGASACSQTSISTRDDALTFVQNEGCLNVLDSCLQHGKPFGGSGSTSGTSPSSGSGCGSCNNNSGSSNDSCNQSCSDCNQNCSDCNQNCSDCNQNNQDCNQNCKGGGCRVSPDARLTEAPGPAAPPPFGAAFWVLVPVAYILRLARRRS